MRRTALVLSLAAAALAAACASTPSETYYAPGAAPLPVAGSTATYSAGTGTVATGVNTFSTSDRLVVGDAAARTTTGENRTAATGGVVNGSAMNPNAGMPAPVASAPADKPLPSR